MHTDVPRLVFIYLFQVGNTGDLSFTPTLDLYVIRFMPVLLLIPVLSRAILVSAAQISSERKIQGNTALTKLIRGFQWQIVCSSIQKGERNIFTDLFLRKFHNNCSHRIVWAFPCVNRSYLLFAGCRCAAFCCVPETLAVSSML